MGLFESVELLAFDDHDDIAFMLHRDIYLLIGGGHFVVQVGILVSECGAKDIDAPQSNTFFRERIEFGHRLQLLHAGAKTFLDLLVSSLSNLCLGALFPLCRRSGRSIG